VILLPGLPIDPRDCLDLPECSSLYIRRRQSGELVNIDTFTPRKGDFIVRRSMGDTEGALVPVESMPEFRRLFPDCLRPGWVWECTGVEPDGLGRETAYWMPVLFDVAIVQSTGNATTKFTGCKVTARFVERGLPFKWRQTPVFDSIIVPHQDARYYALKHPSGRHAQSYDTLLRDAVEATRGRPNDC